MKILIIGGSSLLGRYLLQTLPKGYEVSLTWHRNRPDDGNIWYQLDIRDKLDVNITMSICQPDIVIHCAAIGSVDYAEENYQQVADVNVNGLKNVVYAANKHYASIIYISTNAVYSGKNPPYNEQSPLNAINAYGIIKRQAERIIQDMAENWTIIRPFLLYGWPWPGGRTNWAKSIIEKLTVKSGSYRLVNDHIWQPTYAKELAETIWKLLYQENEIYNVASSERATLYEFALKVCSVFELEESLIKPVMSDYFPTLTKRPHDTSYDLVKLKEAGIVLSDIKTGLEMMKNEHK